MLVLSRKKDEAVKFPGTGIKVRVLKIKGNTVRLGFEAPDGQLILREEIEVHDEPEPELKAA